MASLSLIQIYDNQTGPACIKNFNLAKQFDFHMNMNRQNLSLQQTNKFPCHARVNCLMSFEGLANQQMVALICHAGNYALTLSLVTLDFRTLLHHYHSWV